MPYVYSASNSNSDTNDYGAPESRWQGHRSSSQIIGPTGSIENVDDMLLHCLNLRRVTRQL